MLLYGLLAVALAVPPPSAAPPRKTLGIVPLTVRGTLPDSLRDRTEERIVEGARRGPLEVVRIDDLPAGCTTPVCLAGAASDAAADYLLTTQLVVSDGQRTWAFEARVVDATGREVLATEAGCEVCGFAEAAERIEDAVAVAAKTLERPEAQRSQLDLRGGPAGASVSVDGTIVGQLPIVHDLPPGTHTITIAMDDFHPQTLQVDVSPGTRKILEIELRPVPPPDPRRGRGMVAAGATLLGVSIAAITTGAVFTGLHGQPYRGDCQADREGNCRRLWATGTVGAVLLGTGVAALVTGVTLLAVGKHRQTKTRQSARARLPVRASTSAMRSAAFFDPSFAAVR